MGTVPGGTNRGQASHGPGVIKIHPKSKRAHLDLGEIGSTAPIWQRCCSGLPATSHGNAPQSQPVRWFSGGARSPALLYQPPLLRTRTFLSKEAGAWGCSLRMSMELPTPTLAWLTSGIPPSALEAIIGDNRTRCTTGW